MFSLTVVSMAFSSHLGSLDLAALSIATTLIISFSFGFMLGMASALETLCGQTFGAKSYQMLGIYLQRSWIVLSIFAVLLLPLFIFTGPILKLTGQSEAMADRTGLSALWLENVYYRFVIILSGYLNISGNFPGWSIHLGINDSTGVWGCNGVGQCLVANELGAGKAKAARFAVFNALIVGMIFYLVVIVFSDNLARIFTTSDSVVGAMTQLSTLLAFSILMNCIQPVFSGVAVGCGWQALSTILNLASYYVVGLPLGIIFGCLLPFGIKGIWSGLIGGTVVQTLLLGLVTLKYDWQEEVKKAKNLALEDGGFAEGMIG